MLKIISRSDAKHLMLKQYFTGKPCKYDHISERSTSNGFCIECRRAHGRANNAKRRADPVYAEYQKDYLKSYDHKNKKEVSRRHYLNTLECQRDRSKAKRQRNPDYYKAKLAERRAKKKNATPNWSEKELIQMVYRKGTTLNLEVDHVVPLQSDFVCGLHCWSNLQLLDRQLNAEKGNYIWPDMPDTKDPELLNLVVGFKNVTV